MSTVLLVSSPGSKFWIVCTNCVVLPFSVNWVLSTFRFNVTVKSYAPAPPPEPESVVVAAVACVVAAVAWVVAAVAWVVAAVAWVVVTVTWFSACWIIWKVASWIASGSPALYNQCLIAKLAVLVLPWEPAQSAIVKEITGFAPALLVEVVTQDALSILLIV